MLLCYQAARCHAYMHHNMYHARTATNGTRNKVVCAGFSNEFLGEVHKAMVEGFLFSGRGVASRMLKLMNVPVNARDHKGNWRHHGGAGATHSQGPEVPRQGKSSSTRRPRSRCVWHAGARTHDYSRPRAHA